MDKFAVLQLKKKRAREAEAKAKGQTLDDVVHAEKQVMTEAEIIQMNKAFGYLDPPTAIYAVGKEGKAAVWWIWKNPYKPYYPEPLSDDEDELEKEIDSDNEEELLKQAELKAKRLEEELRKKAEEEAEEEEEQKDEFDEDGNLVIKGPTKRQLEAKRLLKEAKAAARAERERIRAEKVLSGTAKVKVTCTGCGKRFKVGSKTCTKCYRALPQPDMAELARIEEEQKREAEAKIAEDARLKAKKEEERKLRREEQNEQINKRIKGFTIYRYRKDPTSGGVLVTGDNSSTGGNSGGPVRRNSPSRKKMPLSDGYNGPKHHSHNDEFNPAGISMYSHEDPVVPHYTEDNVESDDMGTWRKKGSMFFEYKQDSKDKLQCMLEDLPDNYEYRFTVAAVCGNGTGRESPPSNAVMVEQQLPTGWNRFFDSTRKAFYYANLRCNLALWRRPDLDSYFLEESILLLFNNAEISYLKGLYDEEIAHFKYIMTDRFLDVLSEVGEKISKYRVIKFFQGYAGDDYKFTDWKIFMNIFAHIKRHKMRGGLMAAAASAANVGMMVKQTMAASLLAESEMKFGHWVVEYSHIAEREYYRNKVTKETAWDIPDEIRFFIPPKLEAKLLKSFDYGHIETFKQYFSMLDVDNSGDLSDQEIKRLLNALNINITQSGLEKLVKTVDLNGNGTIEFDEFCWMMYEMSRTDGEGELAGLQGKIPMCSAATGASVGASEASGEKTLNPESTEPGSTRPPTSGTIGGSDGSSSRLATAAAAAAAMPGLNLEALSQNLAVNVGNHLLRVQEMGNGELDNQSQTVPTNDDKVHSLPGDALGVSPQGSARAGGMSTHRSQTNAAMVYVSDNGLLVPAGPATAVNSGDDGSMYASESSNFYIDPGSVPDASAVTKGRVGEGEGEGEAREEEQRALLTPTKKPSQILTVAEDEGVSDDVNSNGAKYSHYTEPPLSHRSGNSAAKSTPRGGTRKVAPTGGGGGDDHDHGHFLDSARSHLSVTTINSEDFANLASGKGRGRETVLHIDPTSSKIEPTAIKGDNFGDLEYDLNEEGWDDSNEIECPICGIASEVYKCKKCYDIGYCSRRCQQDDYPRHRLECIVKSPEEIAAMEEANRENEEKIARELAERQERENKEREEAEYDAMLEEYEDEGGVLVGPEEELDPLTNEPRKIKLDFHKRTSKAVWEYWHPKQAKEMKEKNEKIQKRIDIRREKRKAQEEALRLRDVNNKHGPYCFCGCRAF